MNLGTHLALFYTLCEVAASLPLVNTIHPPKQVLVVSQMRSGSSFVGELFHKYPGSFYLFEPLRALARGKSNDSESFIRTLKGVAFKDETLNKTITDLLNCEFHEIPPHVFKDDFLLRTNYGRNVYNCAKLGNDLDKCLSKLSQYCKNSFIRTIKTVRLTLNMADEVLTMLPDLKIIYLIRDPRAIIQSRIMLHIVNDDNVMAESRDLCERMDKDLNVAKHSNNRGRIKIVQYENVAKNTVKVAKEIYDFIGSELQGDVVEWIKSNALNSFDGNPYSTSRNSTQSTSRWLSLIQPDTAKMVDNVCSHLYENLGYKIFDDIKISE